MRAYLVVFVSVLLAELGDKTQLATLVYAGLSDLSRLGVFAAAAAALLLSTLAAVLAGGHLAAWIAPDRLKTVAGIAFIAIGVWMLLQR